MTTVLKGRLGVAVGIERQVQLSGQLTVDMELKVKDKMPLGRKGRSRGDSIEGAPRAPEHSTHSQRFK